MRSRVLNYIIDMLILSIPFAVDCIGKHISYYSDYPDQTKGHIYAVAIALTYMSLQILWMVKPHYAYKYKREMMWYVVLLVSNLIDAFCTFFPESNISYYKLQYSEYFIAGIVFLALIHIGYQKYKSWIGVMNG